MVAQVGQVLRDVRRVHVVVVYLQQVVLHEPFPFAVHDHARAHVAAHFPDLLHLLLVLAVGLLPEAGADEVEGPLDGGTLAVVLVEEVDVGLLHLLHRTK